MSLTILFSLYCPQKGNFSMYPGKKCYIHEQIFMNAFIVQGLYLVAVSVTQPYLMNPQ